MKNKTNKTRTREMPYPALTISTACTYAAQSFQNVVTKAHSGDSKHRRAAPSHAPLSARSQPKRGFMCARVSRTTQQQHTAMRQHCNTTNVNQRTTMQTAKQLTSAIVQSNLPVVQRSSLCRYSGRAVAKSHLHLQSESMQLLGPPKTHSKTQHGKQIKS